MKKEFVSPEHLMKIAHGAWGTYALGTAIEHSLFTHLGEKEWTSQELAETAGLSARGTQALLDALVAVGILDLQGTKYKNSPASGEYLNEKKPAYLGNFIKLQIWPEFVQTWLKLPAAVKTGKPQTGEGKGTEVAENPFWEELVQAIAPLSVPVAMKVGEDLKLPAWEELNILDIGGGSGIFAQTLLDLNKKARATQLDWKNVNKIARKNADKRALGERFQTLDGDFHTTNLGEKKYDLVLFSHIAHQENPRSNIEVYHRIRKALKPKGFLVINDFVVENDRKGNPFSLLFNCNMLLHTKEGASYTEGDYRSWLTEAGFKTLKWEKTGGPSSLFYASF